MSISIRLVILSALIFSPLPIHALIVGSNSTASRQSTPTFPALDSDNEMRGFAVFEQGFTLEDNTTTCLFNSLFPVSGTVTFNGGSLLLNRNLIFSSDTIFADGGVISGNSYAIELPDTKDLVTLGGAMTLGMVKLVLHADVALSGTVTFTGVCTVEGNGYTVDCSNGTLVVDDGSSVLFKNTCLKQVGDGSVACTDSLGTFSLQDVVWAQTTDFSFTQGKLEVLGDFLITGSSIFAYQSDQVSTIHANAMWRFDTGMTFSYDPSIANNALLAMVDETAVLHLYETTWHVTDVGLQLTKGTLVVEGACAVSNEATGAAEGIIIGDGAVANNNVVIKELAESGLQLVSGYFVYNNVW